jgi:hypothetical protein
MSKKFISFLMFVFIVKTCFAIQVDGHCYLQNQINHTGSKILFEAESPSAVTDSTYTDSSGYYQIELAVGLYDIYFSHENFYGNQLLSRLLYVNTTLPTVTLQMRGTLISGALSGILEEGTYSVIDSIFVQEGDSLIIQPGTTLLFDGDYAFDINGYLSAVGTEADSIRFMCGPIDSAWEGIDFNDSSNNSCRLEYCLITGSNSSGISCIYASPIINNCKIAFNSGPSSDNFGGGVYISGGFPTAINCTITDNYAHVGGGIFCAGGAAQIDDCIICNNYVGFGGRGGGILCYGDSVIIEHCIIRENLGDPSTYGAGIYCSSGVTIRFCTISGNSIENGGYGGGICCGGTVTISNCAISGNSPGVYGYGGGIFFVDYAGTIANTIVQGNLGGGGVYFDAVLMGAAVIYGDFFNNMGGNFVGSGIPPYLGQITTTNHNGDPCDIYYNIFLNPLLVNPSGGNYHLQSGSPCIDAGDPTSPLDPDSTIADIGAFYFNQLGVINHPNPIQTTSYSLLPPYPNPFNNILTIPFNIPFQSKININIYNILGQKVQEFTFPSLSPGAHRVVWNSGSFSSGIYFVRMSVRTPMGTANGQEYEQKVVLLK